MKHGTDVFFSLRAEHKNLIGFKEFGSKEAMRYAAENITSKEEDVLLMVGVDTRVYHGLSIVVQQDLLPVSVRHYQKKFYY